MKVFCLCAVALALSTGCACPPEAHHHEFLAGFAKIAITPPVGTPMGGYAAPNRRVTGVHDDLWARCLVLRAPGGPTLTLVSLDLIGFARYDVQLVKQSIPDPDTTFIFSTHQHYSPDTLGVFGIGRDELYMETVRQRIAEVVRRAREDFETATLYAGSVSGEGISMNWRDPDILNTAISYLEVVPARRNAKLIAMLVNFACHPETFGNGKTTDVSADFPGYVCSEIELQGIASGALYANGALGAMVSVNAEHFSVKTRGGDATKEVGDRIFRRLRTGSQRNPTGVRVCGAIEVRTEQVEIPLENKGFVELIRAGKIPVNPGNYAAGLIKTEVSLVKIGALRILMIPGELSPMVEREFPPDCLVFGLANDEIGYIVAAKDYWQERFKYERTMSVGPQAADRIVTACKKLLAP